MALQTRNVFIDTQSFVKAGLDFRSKAIQAFADAAGDGEFNHLMTTITVQEVKDKIFDSIKEGLSRVMDFRRKAKMLEASTNPIIAGFFAEYDHGSVQSHAQEVFQGFIDDSNATVLDLSKGMRTKFSVSTSTTNHLFKKARRKTNFLMLSAC